ncbi:BRO family protein [Gracilinema caldarium]|uniref:BRO-N domain-containing protein n=1 Tax=Gracilinema caldarium TaxID=215591 RepID=UPI0026F1F2F9|nr:BRO family protein [Gracilinema caldarium]
MNELQFSFNGHNCPVLLNQKNEPWWIARHVCDILGLSDVSMSLQRLDDDEKMIQKLFVSSKMRNVWLVNEPGLYSLVLTSNKPEAKSFKRWITHEVLPAIRKTGSYAVGSGKAETPGRPGLAEAAAFMREARQTFGIRSARRVCKQYLGPENFEPLTRRPKKVVPTTGPDGKTYVEGLPLPIETYRKIYPWYVTPEEEEEFLANWATMTEEERDAFIARAACGKGIVDKKEEGK